jgi:hypothetical protein
MVYRENAFSTRRNGGDGPGYPANYADDGAIRFQSISHFSEHTLDTLTCDTFPRLIV